jgi:sulfur-oxidizing protein SoxB
MELHGKPIDATRKYKVAGWAPVSEESRSTGGEPVYDVVARYLRAQKTIAPRRLNLPKVEGVAGNPGIA